MSRLKRLWAKIARIAEGLEGMDDPTGDYLFSLEQRIDKLERELTQFEKQLHSLHGGSGIQP